MEINLKSTTLSYTMLAYIVQYDNIKKWASFLTHIHVFDFFLMIIFFLFFVCF